MMKLTAKMTKKREYAARKNTHTHTKTAASQHITVVQNQPFHLQRERERGKDQQHKNERIVKSTSSGALLSWCLLYQSTAQTLPEDTIGGYERSACRRTFRVTLLAYDWFNWLANRIANAHNLRKPVFFRSSDEHRSELFELSARRTA